jgi:hypothetical protein
VVERAPGGHSSFSVGARVLREDKKKTRTQRPRTRQTMPCTSAALGTTSRATPLSAGARRSAAPGRRAGGVSVRAFGPGNELKEGVEAGTRVRVTAPIKVCGGRGVCVSRVGRVRVCAGMGQGAGGGRRDSRRAASAAKP